MTRKCSAEVDVQCKACTQCTGSQYQVAPCTSVQDTICIDVSFPLDQLDLDSMRQLPWRGGVANLSGSENVFVERISKIRRLDTALYLSNNQQSMNFLFQRESGIEVKVKVSDVYLVPEYVDLDHIDDSSYYLNSMSIPEEKKKEFRHTTQHYCRQLHGIGAFREQNMELRKGVQPCQSIHPLPDYYHMHLQIYLNRSLAARMITCDSQDSNLPRCPSGYQDGDDHLDVLLDTACSQDPDSTISWKSQVNNIICHDNPDILHHVFKLNMRESSPKTFPSRECQRYKDECLTCLVQNTYSFTGGNSNCSCCNQLKCYNQASCVSLYSPVCPAVSVKCVSADVTKFSIEPRYPSMSEKFMCHLGYLKHRSLYRVYYETNIPKLNFSFETRKRDVLCRNRSFHEDGSDVAEFLHMSHSAQIPIKDEVILEGKYEKNKTNYQLHPLKKPWEFHYKKDFEVNQTNKYYYRAKVQFERPFLYSSSTWQQGGCEKNVSQIHPDQPLYRDHGVTLETPNVKNVDGRFLYPLVANSTPPHIRFYIPENTPILSYYKESLGKSQLIGSSLQGHLNWMADLQMWNITILGVLTSCPSYLTVELYDKYLRGRLDKYEVLVICPVEFRISVQLEDQQANLPDVFVVLINDTMSSHQVVLTSIREPVQLHTSAKIEPAVIFYHQSPWIPIAAIIIFCSMICIFLLVIYVICDRKRKVRTDITLPKPDLGTTITLLSNTDKTQKEPDMTQTSKLIAVLLLMLYMIYALVFTFSTMFGVLYLLQNHSVANLTLVSNTSAKIQNRIQTELQHMKNYEKKETLRILTMAQERHEACAFHLNKSLNDAIRKHRELLRQNLLEIYQMNGTVQLMIENYFQKMSEHYHKQIMEFVADFNDTLNKNLHKIHTRYSAYLRKVAENRWLEFPKEVFIHQMYDEGQEVSSVKNKLGEFLTWLEIGEVKEVMGIKHNVLSRLQKLMPYVELSSFLPKASIATSSGARPEDTLQELATDSLLVSWFTFTSHSQESDFYIGRSDQAGFPDIFRQVDENTIRNMKQILYPTVIGVFLFLDIFLLAFRFSWALKYLQQFKKGIKESVPTELITSKIHFILTGIDYKKTDDPFEHPYEFYKENMEELWGEKHELYFLYCQASQKSKEDILREIWSRNHSMKPKTSTVEKKSNCTSTNFTECFKKDMMYLYRLIISRFFWRFILICAFLLFLCLITKAIDDLVTLEMASFLTDTEAMLNILKRQSEMTNTLIVQYCDHVSKFLSEYQSDLEMELNSLNTLLQEVLTEQTNALNRIVSDLCSLGRDSTCDGSPVTMATFFLTNCQLLSIQPQLYTGFQEKLFTDYISSELSPLVTSLRSILFNAFYILLLFAFLMLMCQILARVIYICLLKSSRLHIKRVYQRPSVLNQWQEPGQSFRDKTYGSQSLIAESCESGVYET
ncbi:hypothetical protein CHS0354_023331 [Potamilus streckersoni]|uniref:Uncharacterized protein n=1 Tax=Potamilus streckersoni TaxID=2493646 RepID=A0AAE0W6B2_9BIVA|nr:hypothetical protein CHS0354_023331 [Potamilus streckersoni]